VAVSRAVAGLMSRGLVERATDRTDRRRASLRLSARGRVMHARIVPIALAYEERLCKALGPAERRSFDALTDRLLTHARRLRPAG
jgi:DNA-binding MarR family transcriptional regulator